MRTIQFISDQDKEQRQKYLGVAAACMEAGVRLPEEVGNYFDVHEPSEALDSPPGRLITKYDVNGQLLTDKPIPGVIQDDLNNNEHYWVDINLSEIPEEVTSIRIETLH